MVLPVESNYQCYIATTTVQTPDGYTYAGKVSHFYFIKSSGYCQYSQVKPLCSIANIDSIHFFFFTSVKLWIQQAIMSLFSTARRLINHSLKPLLQGHITCLSRARRLINHLKPHHLDHMTYLSRVRRLINHSLKPHLQGYITCLSRARRSHD